MHSDSNRSDKRCQRHAKSTRHASPAPWGGRWLRFSPLIGGVFALAWLLLRTGTKPTRLSYPCQQAAFGTAATAFGLPFVAALMSMQGRVTSVLRTASGRIAAGGLLALCTVMIAVGSADESRNVVMLQPRAAYHPDVYLVNDARGIEPGRYGGVDDLITVMGENGLKLHRSTTVSTTSGPEGLIDADDVVLIKVNGQWYERGGTNTDVLRGVMRRVVEHPDGFVGEVIVGENTQSFRPNLDHAENNAEDQSQSIQNVADDFFAVGWNASTMRWDDFRGLSVAEYSGGNMTDGYVVNPIADPQTSIRVSYPKFRSASGTYVSYKHGIWSQATQTYDANKLVVINIPVFKTHATYGITASVKNHMGVVTTALSTGSHSRVGWGGLGSVLAEVRMPDLNILDCIWILARVGTGQVGPGAPYELASRRDQLVASTDPVALDAWATKFIMIPQLIENGYTPIEYSEQNPDNPGGKFRNYLDLSMNELLVAGTDVTSDYTAVNLHVFEDAPIPTVSDWGMVVLALLLFTAGSLAIRRQRAPVAP